MQKVRKNQWITISAKNRQPYCPALIQSFSIFLSIYCDCHAFQGLQYTRSSILLFGANKVQLKVDLMTGPSAANTFILIVKKQIGCLFVINSQKTSSKKAKQYSNPSKQFNKYHFFTMAACGRCVSYGSFFENKAVDFSLWAGDIDGAAAG